MIVNNTTVSYAHIYKVIAIAITTAFMSPFATGFAQNEVLYEHNFKSHFSPPFDKYNHRLTVHACTIA